MKRGVNQKLTIRAEKTPSLLANAVVKEGTPLLVTPEGNPIATQTFAPSQDELVTATLRELCTKLSKTQNQRIFTPAFTVNVGGQCYYIDMERVKVRLAESSDQSPVEMTLAPADWIEMCQG